MASTTTIRMTPARDGGPDTLKVAAVKVLGGTVACINAAGFVTNASATTGLKAWGIATKTVDNSAGAAGDLTIGVETSQGRKDFFFLNDATDPVTQAEIGDDVSFIDNQTVSAVTASRSALVTAVEVTSTGVWVRFKQ